MFPSPEIPMPNINKREGKKIKSKHYKGLIGMPTSAENQIVLDKQRLQTGARNQIYHEKI